VAQTQDGEPAAAMVTAGSGLSLMPAANCDMAGCRGCRCRRAVAKIKGPARYRWHRSAMR
jgi:hypothetical protein